MKSTWVQLLWGILAVGGIFMAVALGASILIWAPLRRSDTDAAESEDRERDQ